MKKHNKHIILALACLLCLFSCSEDNEVAEQDVVEYCIGMSWSNGRGTTTRTALPSLLSGETKSDFDILPSDYPDEINVVCNEQNYILTKPSTLVFCTEHTKFYNGYTADKPIKEVDVKRGISATATLADGYKLQSRDADIKLEGKHLQFIFHHTKALVRFFFKVNNDYDKIRYIVVKAVSIKKGTDPAIEAQMKDGGLLLTTDDLHCAGYCYIDPDVITANTPVQISCTYDIYDKDADFSSTPAVDNSAHLTRENVIATNNTSLKMVFNDAAATIKVGYYYDLNVTINPDYLYVLSEHDNKHLVIE